MRLIWLSVVPMLLLAACTEDVYNPSEANEVVVDGCLIANTPGDSIRISPLIPYGGDSASIKPITNASVTISHGPATFSLIVTGDSGYYRIADSSFRPMEGETYTLSCVCNGKNISASATIPKKPAGLSLSADTLAIDTTVSLFEMMREQRTGGQIPEIILRFNNPDTAYNYVVVQSMDSTAVSLRSDTLGFRGARFLSSPFKDTSYAITFAQVSKLGKHRVILFRVNQEYEDLYNNRRQDSRSLNEPKTNIVNGLGIFTAVNCDSAFFYVKAK